MAEHWIVPCNIKVFDVIAHFKDHTHVVWKNAFTIKKGDIVYLYLSSPYGEIKYKCLVTSDSISDQKLQENPYAIRTKASYNYYSRKIKYIEMLYLREYPSQTFPLETLKKHGLGQVQIQARTDRRLQHFIDEVEEQLTKQTEGG